MESSYEETLRVERLNLLRRVCGGRSKNFTDSHAKSCALVTSKFKKISHGMALTFRRTTWHTLQRGVVKVVQQDDDIGTFGDPVINHARKAKADVKNAAKLWIGYDSDLSASERPVFSQKIMCDRKEEEDLSKKAGGPKNKRLTHRGSLSVHCLLHHLLHHRPRQPQSKKCPLILCLMW